ncbi:MAG: hypothetical protein AVDCRST_MAG64-1475, partial [uncultured Phycisphaerae bacterium]
WCCRRPYNFSKPGNEPPPCGRTSARSNCWRRLTRTSAATSSAGGRSANATGGCWRCAPARSGRNSAASPGARRAGNRSNSPSARATSPRPIPRGATPTPLTTSTRPARRAT